MCSKVTICQILYYGLKWPLLHILLLQRTQNHGNMDGNACLQGLFMFFFFFFFIDLLAKYNFQVLILKPPFLRDTENRGNSRNRGVENRKWQVSFSEMIRLIFVQNLSQFGRAFNKMLGKVYLLPTFPSKCCFICLLGVILLQFECPFRLSSERKCLSSSHFVCLHLAKCFYNIAKNSLDFQILLLLFRKMVNFGLFVLFLIENGKTRKMVNLQNGIWIL